jgi:hypothetical protein
MKKKHSEAQNHDSYITMCHHDRNLQYVKDSRFFFQGVDLDTYIPMTHLSILSSHTRYSYQLPIDTSFINYQTITTSCHIILHSKKLKIINLTHMISILNSVLTVVFYVTR